MTEPKWDELAEQFKPHLVDLRLRGEDEEEYDWRHSWSPTTNQKNRHSVIRRGHTFPDNAHSHNNAEPIASLLSVFAEPPGGDCRIHLRRKRDSEHQCGEATSSTHRSQRCPPLRAKDRAFPAPEDEYDGERDKHCQSKRNDGEDERGDPERIVCKVA